ncbi:MAG: 7TM-DISM domain-containing protein [Bacteroidales bacterium]|nr:7TM-DISM domain-containing protein [Bacteroidales bacterium]
MKKKILLYAGIVVGLLVLAYAYVPQVLGGKIVNQSDISGWQGMSREMMEWNAAHPDDQTAWTGSMFGGMPTATIHASTQGDWTQKIYDFLLVGRRPATYLFISLLGAWLLMLALGIHPLIAVGGAVAVTLCSYNLQIIQVGHNTKMQALAFLPWVLAALLFTYKKALSGKPGKGWLPGTVLGAALFGLALSFQVKANHPQITYYLALLILIYVIVLVVWMLRNKQSFGRFFAASALLLVLGVAGIATNATKLLPTLEYTPYSMRGGSTAASEGGEGAKGLDLDYATAWSYGWEELPNLLIPNFNGGSSAGAVNPKHSETYDLLKQAGQPNLREISQNLPLYWGPQPFTAGPMYMGAITIFLFVLGLFAFKGKEKWWIVAGTVLAVLLALGSHFMAFTKFFYNVAPLYNKFRTVSMALVVLQFTLPMLGFLVLDRIVREPEAAEFFRRKGWIAAAITGGFCLLCALIPGIAGTFTGAVDNGQPDVLVDALAADRRHLLVVDALRSLLLIGAAFALMWWGTSVPKDAKKTFATQPEIGRGRRLTASLLVAVLVLFDLGTVGKRYLNADDFVSPRSFQSQFNKRPVDELILSDTDPSFRVLDLSVNVFNDSRPSYWHKNIGGYSPAKLQRYQEFIESTLTGEINQIYKAIGEAKTIEEAEAALPYLPGLAQMNCRYIILDGEMPPLKYPYAKGNAWFGNGGTVELTSYAPNELRYRYSSPEDARLVFSEVYYPVGWKLTVEDTGVELPIELEGSLLRAAVVPAGEHSLVMRFDPPSYRQGAAISRTSSILLILAALAAVLGAALPRKFFHKRS